MKKFHFMRNHCPQGLATHLDCNKILSELARMGEEKPILSSLGLALI